MSVSEKCRLVWRDIHEYCENNFQPFSRENPPKILLDVPTGMKFYKYVFIVIIVLFIAYVL